MARYIHRDRSKAISLRSYPDEPSRVVPIKLVSKEITKQKSAADSYRRKYGRAINLDNIETALRTASRGSMTMLTDLSRETIDTDPHLASVLAKRFGAVSCIPFEIHPATGYNIDKDKALFYAAVVREQVYNLRNFRDVIARVAWGIFDGRCAQELKWMYIDGPENKKFGKVTMAINNVEWIHPRRINIGPSRELRIIDESSSISSEFSTNGLSLAEEDLKSAGLWRKFIQWKPQLFCEYVEREGLAPRCLYWSFFKRFSARDRMMLLELFGKPWRILEVPEDSTASEEDLEEAEDVLDSLGYSYTARLPKGTTLNVEQPGRTAGQVHQEVIEESDRQISKLVLGQTGTTDAVPAGINNPQARVMQDEQQMILQRDTKGINEVIEYDICDAIIEVNFGTEELTHSPKFVLRSDLPVDRNAEVGRLTGALNAGLTIALDEAYELIGFRRPDPSEPYLKIDQPPTPSLSPVPPPRSAVIVYPFDESPNAGEQQPIAPTASTSDGAKTEESGQAGAANVAKYITVNEARAADGLGPLKLPNGDEDPDGYLTLIEFENKKTEKDKTSETPEKEIKDDNGDDADMSTSISNEKIALAFQNPEVICSILASRASIAAEKVYELQSDHLQPTTALGSPEDIINRGVKQLSKETKIWADEYAAAINGLVSPIEIYKTLNQVYENLEMQGYGRVMERQLIHSASLGILDSAVEIGQLDDELNKAEFAAKNKTPYSTMSFDEAMKVFKSKNVVTKGVFSDLSAAAKIRSFTAAGINSTRMLQVIHDELAKQIAVGTDLATFSKFMIDRLKSAGMIASKIPESGLLSASHIETVFRTNTLGAYNAGRFKHMSQPAVLRARPIWEFSPISDNRTRSTHLAVKGIKLFANDPFWKRAYPPFGFDCRCRVISRPATYFNQVIQGNQISGLPDPGFASGTPFLI